jgi:hypothetical protein
MKKILLVITLLLSSNVLAQHHHGHHGYYREPNRSSWVAPLLLGATAGYIMSRPTVIYNQPPMIYNPPSVTYVQPGAPIGYHYEQILDANCNCYRTILVSN